LAARILRAARREEDGCLTSLLRPSQKRPNVEIAGGAKVCITRVVMANHLGRVIGVDEDVHHQKCRNVRCVEPTHLAVIPTAEHQAHHAQEQRQALCPRHGTPYDRRSTSGPHCRKCEAEASARYRRNHPDFRRPPRTEEQRLRHNELVRRRYHEKRRARQVA
jgi:hypothetical protein